MTATDGSFAAAHYAPRAQDYVTSTVHATGADLDQIEALVRGRPTARVLDLGCGGGHVSYRAARHVAEVVACDVTAAMLDAVRATATDRGLANIAVQQASAESLPFADGSFDIVLCRFTTHHWHDMEAGLREARRVLKPGGPSLFVDIVAPARPLLDTHLQAVELLRDPSHVRNYSLAEWAAALARSGFGIEGVTMRTLRMDFPTWTARTQTATLHADAIRALQAGAPPAVRAHFGIGPDGSFDIVSAAFELSAA